MKKKFLTGLTIGVLLCGLVGMASATSILYSDSGGDSNYGIGHSAWDNFTSALNTATDNNLISTSNFEDYNQMLQYDAIFLDQRWAGGSLSASEITNITDYIATGNKVVMMGENSAWTYWNVQLMSIVGGVYSGANASGTTNRVIDNELTSNAMSLLLPFAGIVSSGGTALYDKNFATLWETNVLTVLDVNVWSDNYWNDANNSNFGVNVANWIADSGSPAPVPEPATMLLFGTGLVGLVVSRIRKKKK